MRSIFEKYRILNTLPAQIAIVILAISIIIISSCFFFSIIDKNHLTKEIERSLDITENEIMSVCREPDIFLTSYSETLRSMILRGYYDDTIPAYMASINNFITNHMGQEGLVGLHGVLLTFSDKYIPCGNRPLPENFNPKETEWYKLAISAKGRVAVSNPYVSPFFSFNILTFSRAIFDDDGGPLGVICLDFDLKKISTVVFNFNYTENSYAFLLNNRLDIIAHPSYNAVNAHIADVEAGITDIIPDLQTGKNIHSYKFINYMNEASFIFSKTLKMGWRLFIVVPEKDFYSYIIKVTVFLIICGILLAALICGILYHIYGEKINSDKKTRQKSNFLATMSHEIRTPLNAILGMTEIQMQNSMHPPATSEAFIKINNSGSLLLNIINDILDLSKIEAGDFELMPVKYEVASMINDVAQLNYIRYEGVPVDFNVEVDENTPASLIGDELRIKQVLNNLLSNAFKYTEKGSVTFSAGADCVSRAGTVFVTLVFKIIDTGQGMTQKQVDNLFNEYTHFNMKANRTTEGAGLGITVTRNLVDLMNGQINIKSAIGEGTTVTVRLPQKTPGIGVRDLIGKEVTENLKQFKLGNFVRLKKSQVKHEYMPYGSVLIVDDVETNLYVAKGLMAPYGLNIDIATSGFEAIEKLKNGNVFDIIFMDHMMPKLDGIEATKIIREAGYKQPIVALTANALAGQADVFMKNGFDGFISKPIDIRQLNVTLIKFIRNKQSQETIDAAQKEKVEFDKKQAEKTTQGRQIDPQLANIFTRDAEKAIIALDGVFQKNFSTESDVQLFIINVHAMKSALANIGESNISATALKLEQAGREKDFKLMKAETKNFLDDLRGVIGKIKPKDEDDAGVEDSREALALLREKLTEIKNSCDAYDKKTVKTILGELKEKTWSKKTKGLMNSISDHLLHSEFDEISALADDYIKTIE